MELPDDILQIIYEYSRPIGLRLDWRKGSYINRNILLDLGTELYIQKNYMYRIVSHFSSFFMTTTIYDIHLNQITMIL
jgi:hypothetical protein